MKTSHNNKNTHHNTTSRNNTKSDTSIHLKNYHKQKDSLTETKKQKYQELYKVYVGNNIEASTRDNNKKTKYKRDDSLKLSESSDFELSCSFYSHVSDSSKTHSSYRHSNNTTLYNNTESSEMKQTQKFKTHEKKNFISGSYKNNKTTHFNILKKGKIKDKKSYHSRGDDATKLSITNSLFKESQSFSGVNDIFNSSENNALNEFMKLNSKNNSSNISSSDSICTDKTKPLPAVAGRFNMLFNVIDNYFVSHITTGCTEISSCPESLSPVTFA